MVLQATLHRVLEIWCNSVLELLQLMVLHRDNRHRAIATTVSIIEYLSSGMPQQQNQLPLQDERVSAPTSGLSA